MRLVSLRSLVGCGFLLMGAVISLSLSQSQVEAQQNNNKSLAEIIGGWKAQPEFQSKIEAIQGTSIYVLNFANERINITVLPAYTKTVSVKGTGDISAVKSGMGVRFAGKLDEDGVVAEKVAEFYLVTADPYPPEVPLGEDAEIVGKINSFDPKTNTIKLAVNGVKKELKGEKEVITKKVKLATVTLADEPKINVDLRDLSLAHKNDMITVSGRVAKQIRQSGNGWTVGAEIPNQIIAESVIVDLAEPLSFGKKRVIKTDPKEEGKGEKVDPFAEGAKQANGEEPKKEEPKKADPKKEAK